MMNVYQSQAKIKSFNNTDMPENLMKGLLTTVSNTCFFCMESSIIIHLMLYIFYDTFVYKYITNEYKLSMKICIIHFASSLLRIFLAKMFFQEILYGVLLVLYKCCFHHLVENSILYKRDIQHFCIGPLLFSENKIIRSVVGRKIDSQILFGARSEKPKILFESRGEKRKNLFGAK